MTRRQISLAHLTAIDLPPPALIRTAARIGYDAVGLRLIAVTDTSPGYPLMSDPAMMRETKAALAETGLRVADIEFVKITPELDPLSLLPVLEAGAELGAGFIITAPYDPDVNRLSDRLARVAELGAEHGIRPMLEFFPWTVVPGLADAMRVVDATGRDDVGILVDTLHFDRSGSNPGDLANVPAHRLPFVHVCDAPVLPEYSTEELLHTARAERLPPGEGDIDIGRILSGMPSGIPISLEVPMVAACTAKGPDAAARRAFKALSCLLDD